MTMTEEQRKARAAKSAATAAARRDAQRAERQQAAAEAEAERVASHERHIAGVARAVRALPDRALYDFAQQLPHEFLLYWLAGQHDALSAAKGRPE